MENIYTFNKNYVRCFYLQVDGNKVIIVIDITIWFLLGFQRQYQFLKSQALDSLTLRQISADLNKTKDVLALTEEIVLA